MGVAEVDVLGVEVELAEAAFFEEQPGAVLREAGLAGELVAAAHLAQHRTRALAEVHFRQVDLAVGLEVRVPLQVALHVLVEVALLREGQLAVLLDREGAAVGSLVGVDPQVVVEVVPLPEVHRAVGVVALQNFEVALRLGVLELENPEHLRRGNVRVRLLLIDFELLIQAYLAAENDLNLVALRRNLTQNALVFNLVPREHDALFVGVVDQRAVLAETLGFVLASAAGRGQVFGRGALLVEVLGKLERGLGVRGSNFEVAHFVAVLLCLGPGSPLVPGWAHVRDRGLPDILRGAVFGLTFLSDSRLDAERCVVLLHAAEKSKAALNFLDVALAETLQKVLLVAFETTRAVELGAVLVVFGASRSLVSGLPEQ